MENKQSVKRMLSQDIGKGLCVIGIVLSHTMALPVLAMQIIFSVFAFALSFFFVISGYNYHGRKGSYGQTIFKRFKQLFLPFFVILLISLVIYTPIGIFYYGASIKDIGINTLESFVGMHDMSAVNSALVPSVKAFFIPSWFIWYMFGGYVIFYAIADWALTNNKRTFAVIFGLIAITFGLSIFENLGVKPFVIFSSMPFGRTLICSPFVAAQLILGAFFGKKKLFASTTMKKGVLIGTSLGAFTIATAFGFCFPMVGSFSGGVLNGTMIFSAKFGIWECLITFVIGALFTYYFINFSKLVEKVSFLSKPLVFLGQHSMEIYLLHFPFSMLIRHFFNLPVSPVVPFPAAIQVETFDIRYLWVFLISLVVVAVGVYVYCLIKNHIKNKKLQAQIAA